MNTYILLFLLVGPVGCNSKTKTFDHGYGHLYDMLVLEQTDIILQESMLDAI